MADVRILSQYVGAVNFVFQDPLRRDTLSLLRDSWVIIRVVTDTPGIWGELGRQNSAK
jgi:hypothetical protein